LNIYIYSFCIKNSKVITDTCTLYNFNHENLSLSVNCKNYSVLRLIRYGTTFQQI